jgi:2-polyprenyl-3-methyl-5-hydroxy-6-metoxy-1,4-benzoquinol methylase
MPASIIQTDFDRLARLSTEGWDHNTHYHPFLLRHVPSPCVYALDIGCGAGVFSRRLALQARHVLAVDLSPEMIRVAQRQATANIEFQLADALAADWPIDHFDCMVSIATLHHLPLEPMLIKMAAALRGGGTLMVLDLFRATTLADRVVGALGAPASIMLNLVKTSHLRQPPEVRAAWAEHSRHDQLLSLSEVRRIAATVLPGARLTRHLLWRYSLIWTKPYTT